MKWFLSELIVFQSFENWFARLLMNNSGFSVQGGRGLYQKELRSSTALNWLLTKISQSANIVVKTFSIVKIFSYCSR